MSNIDAAVRVLKALRNDTAPTPGQPTFQDQLKEDLIDGQFRGHHVITKSRHIFSSTKNAYVDGLIDNIESRFPNQELMTSMCVLGMRPVSLLTDQDLADWGNDSIEVLISHFGVEQVHTYKDDQQVVQKVKAGSVINPQQTRNEWMSLKKVVKAHGYPRRSTAEFWGIVKQYHGEDYPNLLHLAALALTHPVHTSDCERAFSAKDMVTTPLRNRLSSEHCDQLMRIMIQGSDLKNFNFLPVLKDWKESKCRSLFTGHK